MDNLELLESVIGKLLKSIEESSVYDLESKKRIVYDKLDEFVRDNYDILEEFDLEDA